MPKNESEYQSRKAYKQSKKEQDPIEDEQVDSESQTRKEQKQKQKEEKEQNKLPRRRIFPIWLRIIVIVIIAAGALIAGLMIGYGVIGDGNPIDALDVDTWQHLIDIVIGNVN
ncbi:lipid-binding SYLF domain-containing protein [Virgibacillus natechei]|uniref:Lipid-binding SYLF domain-containing protein n=1 Tax=Virgibacillus natechei TaxID=1216297 RepID=A0ABS4IMM4_9BACI|nr:DNA-directed RNA polymerase subunit beta [Virgibacillus natechei]MBP1971681.1 lipid-binding SYLF domain-containing protein [Virgibacillus natechei]UZD12570.1 DNA-directed RNA polymerase subunit beta [Virgibacillus natechei]